jgi:hypothetical protein
MKNEPNRTDATYSLRSQRSLLREVELSADLRKCEALIGYTERKIGELEISKARQLKGSLSHDGMDRLVLSRTLEELENENRIVVSYREQRDRIQAEIAKLTPSPAQAAERAHRQNYLAQLAADRLKKDELVEGALKGLRRLLQERAELTDKMLKAAEAVDFTVDGDGLDARRFDELLAALPGELALSSEHWLEWFLGKGESLKTYVVRDKSLTVPETLGNPGVVHFGDRIELRQDQARELLREDRPAGDPNQPWRHLPPSIMTVEDYEAMVRAAEKKGFPLQDFRSTEDLERDKKAKERFIEERFGKQL